MAGTLAVSFDLVQSAQRSGASVTIEEEGSFFERKLAWAFEGLTTAPIIGGSGCAQTLSVVRAGDPSPVQFRLNGTVVEMQEDSGDFTPITTGNVSVSCLQFASIAAAGSGPAGVVATTTINGVDFVVTKYIRP